MRMNGEACNVTGREAERNIKLGYLAVASSRILSSIFMKEEMRVLPKSRRLWRKFSEETFAS